MVQGTGILTGGIDCPHLNAVIRVQSALPFGYRMPGTRDTRPGLIGATANPSWTCRSQKNISRGASSLPFHVPIRSKILPVLLHMQQVRQQDQRHEHHEHDVADGRDDMGGVFHQAAPVQQPVHAFF